MVSSISDNEEPKELEERRQQRQEDNGNDGSISDNNGDDDDDDSAQGVPKEGLHWQSDRGSTSSGSTSPVPSLTATGAGEEEEDPPLKASSSSTGKRKRAEEAPTPAVDNKKNETMGNENHDPHSKLTEYQRKLRNEREKKRSGKICDQFDQIRDAMVRAGVIVPKGTKGTILAAAQEYIRMLQEQQKRVALDNCLLVHQLNKIGEGALGAPASSAVRHVAEKNGVTQIVWPNNQTNIKASGPTPSEQAAPDYAVAFRNAPVAMAIATLGGNLLDCNEQFCQVTNLSKLQVKSQTIFTLIDQDELTNAFDRISQWIYSMTTGATAQAATPSRNPIVLKSIIVPDESSANLQVCLSPIKETAALRYLCVTLTGRPPVMMREMNLASNANGMAPTLQEEKSTKATHNTSFYAIG